MIKTEIQNALINSSASSLSYKEHFPHHFKDRHYEFLNSETKTFMQEYARFSSDYVSASVQGLNPERPFEYTDVHLRFANIVKPSGAMSSAFDNYKNIMLVERQYGYLRRGAKIKTMGNTWLILNPQNASDGSTAVIQRCDCVWNYLDYYGNICSEPMAIDNLLKRANTPDSQRSTMITKGYFNATIQYNEATKQLFENSRIILGSSAYILTGFSDFQREWTDDEGSVNLMEFSLRYEEPNDAIDDMEHHVAGGKTFAWDINIGGESTITVGETVQLEASSIRTSGAKTEIVEDTDEHPIDYIWESSDEDIATVDINGNVTGVAEGDVTITATLSQNTDKIQEFNMTIASVDTEPHVSFTSTYPEALQMYKSITLEAVYYEQGEATEETVTWTIEGADEEAYTFRVGTDNPNTALLACWGGSVAPAVITASYGDYSTSVTIELEGI